MNFKSIYVILKACESEWHDCHAGNIEKTGVTKFD